jgi:hypothetical protein
MGKFIKIDWNFFTLKGEREEVKFITAITSKGD